MRDVHIKDCVVNFCQFVEVPNGGHNEPAFFRLRVKPRETKRNIDNILPFDKCVKELMTRWDDDGEAEGVDAA